MCLPTTFLILDQSNNRRQRRFLPGIVGKNMRRNAVFSELVTMTVIPPPQPVFSVERRARRDRVRIAPPRPDRVLMGFATVALAAVAMLFGIGIFSLLLL